MCGLIAQAVKIVEHAYQIGGWAAAGDQNDALTAVIGLERLEKCGHAPREFGPVKEAAPHLDHCQRRVGFMSGRP